MTPIRKVDVAETTACDLEWDMPSERDRFMAVMNGEPVDRVPWVARMDIWYQARLNTGTLPDEFQGCDLYEIHRRIGMGILGRYPLFKDVYDDSIRVNTINEGDVITTTYSTPRGIVSTRDELSPVLKKMGVESPLRMEFMIKDEADYEVVRYILEHTVYEPDYENYLDYDEKIGPLGVTLAFINRSPLQRLLLEFMGYEQTYFEMEDHPLKVAEILELLTEKGRELMEIAAKSPAPLIWSPDNLHAVITSPKLFRRYCVPYFQELTQVMHEAGKYVFSHVDGEALGLLEPFVDSGVDVIEAFAPSPMTRCTMAEARRVCGNKVKIWGGIPSAVLGEEFSDDDFETFLRGIFREAAPGDSLILGVGDNVMPESIIDRVSKVRGYVDKYALFPIPSD